MLIFPLDQLPNMTRGQGVRIQKYKDGGIADICTFNSADGLSWMDSAGRRYDRTMVELAEWMGERAQSGRMPPVGFPKTNQFGMEIFKGDITKEG